MTRADFAEFGRLTIRLGGRRPNIGFLLLLTILLLIPSTLPAVTSQPDPVIVNGISNAGFEVPNEAWEDPFNQSNPVNYVTGSHSGLSAKLSAPINKADTVSAFVGQSVPLPDPPWNTSLANIASFPNSLSVWWYVEPEPNGPDSLEIQIFISDGVSRSFTLGYFYGSSDVGNATTSRHYRLGLVAENQWFETRRNLYQDVRPFPYTDLSSFQVTYIFFGALGNYTHGETVWVDDANLMFNPPAPSFQVDQPSSSELKFVFDASSSLASEGAVIVRYIWDLGDGSKQTYNTPTFTYTYSNSAAYQVTLQVEDSKGAVAANSRHILAFTADQNDNPQFPTSAILVVYASGLVMLSVFIAALLIPRRRRH